MAQLVECPTEKPGAILMWVLVPGAARDFSPRVNNQCRLSVLSIQPPCEIACINICVHIKNPECWQPYLPLFVKYYTLTDRNG